MKESGFTIKKAKNRWYPAETITDADNPDDLILLVNLPAWSKQQEASVLM